MREAFCAELEWLNQQKLSCTSLHKTKTCLSLWLQRSIFRNPVPEASSVVCSRKIWFLRPIHLVQGPASEGRSEVGCRLTYTAGGWQQLVLCGTHTWCSRFGSPETGAVSAALVLQILWDLSISYWGKKTKLNCCVGISSLMVFWVYKNVNSDLETLSFKNKFRLSQQSIDIDRNVSL